MSADDDSDVAKTLAHASLFSDQWAIDWLVVVPLLKGQRDGEEEERREKRRKERRVERGVERQRRCREEWKNQGRVGNLYKGENGGAKEWEEEGKTKEWEEEFEKEKVTKLIQSDDCKQSNGVNELIQCGDYSGPNNNTLSFPMPILKEHVASIASLLSYPIYSCCTHCSWLSMVCVNSLFNAYFINNASLVELTECDVSVSLVSCWALIAAAAAA